MLSAGAAQVAAPAAPRARASAWVAAGPVVVPACAVAAMATEISTATSKVAAAVAPSSAGDIMVVSGTGPEDGGSGAGTGIHTAWARAGSRRQSATFGLAVEVLAEVPAKGASMSETTPWVAQVFERDRKFERFRAALEAIANRAPELDAMAPDEALREVTGIARAALEQ
jgi:hypothetical protein